MTYRRRLALLFAVGTAGVVAAVAALALAGPAGANYPTCGSNHSSTNEWWLTEIGWITRSALWN